MSSNVTFSRVYVSISAVIAEIDSRTTIKPKQDYALAELLGGHIVLVILLHPLNNTLPWRHMFCNADWLREVVCQGKYSRPLKSMCAPRGQD